MITVFKNKVKEQHFFVSIIFSFLLVLVWFLFLFLTMQYPKGLIVETPTTALSLDSDRAKRNISLSEINSDNLFEKFGLVFNPIEPEPKIEDFQEAKAIIEEIIPAPAPAPEEIIEEPEESIEDEEKIEFLDLFAIGYRLKGIIREKNKSAVFIYDPSEKKEKLLRESASDTIKIISTGNRWVKLSTPQGKGIIRLENTDLKVGTTPTAANVSHPPPPPPQRREVEQIRNQSDVEELFARKNLDARIIAGKLNLTVNKPNPYLEKIGLRRGDQIISVGNSDLKTAPDAIKKLSELGDRPNRLKVKRGKDVFFINTPPPEGSVPKQ